jgi:hypothetical protein
LFGRNSRFCANATCDVCQARYAGKITRCRRPFGDRF